MPGQSLRIPRQSRGTHSQDNTQYLWWELAIRATMHSVQPGWENPWVQRHKGRQCAQAYSAHTHTYTHSSVYYRRAGSQTYFNPTASWAGNWDMAHHRLELLGQSGQ
eukprot:6475769-Amphidinium_carterae.1